MECVCQTMSTIETLVRKIDQLQKDRRFAIAKAMVENTDPAALIDEYLSFRSVADNARYAARTQPQHYKPAPRPQPALTYAVA